MHPQLVALNESIFDKGIAESIIYYLILHAYLWPSTACCVKCIHYYINNGCIQAYILENKKAANSGLIFIFYLLFLYFVCIFYLILI